MYEGELGLLHSKIKGIQRQQYQDDLSTMDKQDDEPDGFN